MKNETVSNLNGQTCQLPRKQKAIEALFSLAWRKTKKERPNWLIKELNSY